MSVAHRVANRNGGLPARRAVARWARRLLRRDWRQHLLIVLLLAASVASAVGLACAAYNIAPASGRAEFGNANHFFRINNPDPATLPALLDAAATHFGAIDAVGHRLVPVPGLDDQVDYRAQQPGGPFGGPLLDLRAGRSPTSDDEAAITEWVARTLDAGIGSTIDLDGVDRTVVGIVENPSDLDDHFVLLPISQLATSSYVTMLVNSGEDRIQSFRPPGEDGRIVAARGDTPEDLGAAIIVLVVSTVVLLLVALVAAASFTVIAQRRLPQLGMMSAIGATEKHLRLTMLATGAVTGVVASILGAAVGLVGWMLIAPRMEGAVGNRIDALNIPWWLVAVSSFLAVLAATGAAWWPGRTMSRIPTVSALSGRPPRPAPLHRSSLLSVALLSGGVVCLFIGGRARDTASTLQVVLILVGIVAVLVGVLLIGPLAIRALARLAPHVPVSARLALRDLSRYQARSGSALAAIALAIGIPVAVVATTAAAENNIGIGNLSSTQLVLHPPRVDGPFVPDAASIARMRPGVDAVAAGLPKSTTIELNVAFNPEVEQPHSADGRPAISVARHVEGGWVDQGLIYVASPAILAELDLTADALDNADIATNLRGNDIDIMDMGGPSVASRDSFEHLDAPRSLPDNYHSLPRTLIHPARLAARGWQSIPSGRWLIQTTTPLTSGQLKATRIIAAQYGLTVERRTSAKSLANVRLGAVAVGMLLALAVLAMTVGLIRSESASEVRTLTATGATRSTRRNITATTAGGLAALGAVLGTAGAYAALAAGRIGSLTPLPTLDLTTIVVGTPLAAGIVGWLFAGREPAVIARRPIV